MTCFLNCCFHMFFQVRHPSPCHFLFPCLPVQVTAHCLFQAFNSHDCMFGRQPFYLWSAHSHKHHNSLAASSSRDLLLFPGCPPSHETSFKVTWLYSDLYLRKFPVFPHVPTNLSYTTEILRPQPIQYHLLTHSACLPGPISCFLPYTPTLKSSGRT